MCGKGYSHLEFQIATQEQTRREKLGIAVVTSDWRNKAKAGWLSLKRNQGEDEICTTKHNGFKICITSKDSAVSVEEDDG